MRGILLLTTLGFATTSFAAAPAEWPQFRGPGGSGVAPDSEKPPTELALGKNLKWKVKAPSGVSSPLIVGDRLILTGFEAGKLLTFAYSRSDGSELWRKESPTTKLEAFSIDEGNPAASTPATDGERLVVYFGSYGLICYDMFSREIWRHELPEGETFQGFGTGSSPVIADGRVVLLRDVEKDGMLLCLDLKTGKKEWEAKRSGYKTSWGSPCIWDTPSGKQVVVAGGLRLQGYDLKMGDLVWTVGGLPSYQCTTPVVDDGKLIYAGWSYGGSDEFKMPKFDDVLKEAGEEKLGYLTKAGGEKTILKGHFDGSDPNKDGKITREEWDTQAKYMSSGKNVAVALKPGGKGEITATHVLWNVSIGLPYIPSPLVYKGLMYTVNKQGRLSAFNVKTGKAVYINEQIGLTGAYASPVAANGHIYLCGLDKSVIVMRAGDEPERISSVKLDDRIAATPAIAGNTIYIRTQKTLYAFAEK
jgi:outer membrane protein assembly factor BamB